MSERITMYTSESGLERYKAGVEFLAVKEPSFYNCYRFTVDIKDTEQEKDAVIVHFRSFNYIPSKKNAGKTDNAL